MKKCNSLRDTSLGVFLAETEDAVLILDRQGCCIAVNQATCDLFGLSQEQLLHQSIANLMAPESWQRLQHLPPEQRLIQFQIGHPDQNARSIRGTVISNRRLQQDLWLLHPVAPEPATQKARNAEVAKTHQALDQTQAETHQGLPFPLWHNEAWLEQEFWLQPELPQIFMQSAPIGMLMLDRQFRCIRLNPALTTITGVTTEEHLGKTVWDFVPKIAQQQTAIFEQVLATGQPVLNLEVTGELVHQPGIYRTWLASYFPIREQTSEPLPCSSPPIIGIGVIVREITEIKRIQLQLQQVNAKLEVQIQQQTVELQQSLRFEAMLKRITDKVRDSLDETQILQTAVEELKRSLKTLSCDTGLYDLGKRVSLIAYESIQTKVASAKGKSVPIDEYREVYDQLLSGQYVHFCWLPYCLDSMIRPSKHLTTLAVPLMDEQEVIGDMWLYRPKEQPFEPAEIRLVQQFANQCAIALRQSRLYQAAQQQVDELERLNRLKDDFLNTVSHELRTPIASLKMAIQMLELHLTPLGLLADPSMPIANYFKILSEECDREILLINDLLDLARLDADTELHQVGAIDLKVWLPHLAEVFQSRMAGKQQQFTLAIDANLPSPQTDVFYLERIMVELLTNACKYTPAHESIYLTAQFLAEQIQIQVRNTGVEIPTAERDRIFDKFYRIPNNDPWKHGGTGLGLALIQKMVHRLGGTILVDSGCDRGKGYTCFTLTLPHFLQE